LGLPQRQEGGDIVEPLAYSRKDVRDAKCVDRRYIEQAWDAVFWNRAVTALLIPTITPRQDLGRDA